MAYKGFIVGKFAPLHDGHIYFIKKALELCDELFIIVSSDPRFDDKLPKELKEPLSLYNRMNCLRDMVKDLSKSDTSKRIYIGCVNERDIPECPNGWPEFVALCKYEMSKYGYTPDAVFSSEPSYNDGYNKYLPECKHIVINATRETVLLSATKVRNVVMDLYKNVRNTTFTDISFGLLRNIPWYTAKLFANMLNINYNYLKEYYYGDE